MIIFLFTFIHILTIEFVEGLPLTQSKSQLNAVLGITFSDKILPFLILGARKDGSSVHFFNRTVNAYATGQRKRRKIHHQHGLTHEEHVRWHKTGKTKPVIEDGVHKGFKKIMVLYVSSQKRSKPYKSNWVMHQYHLGSEEEEKDGEYVVSKVFYQPNKHTEKNEENPVAEGSDMASRTDPRTPNPNPPGRPHTDIHVDCDDNFDDSELPLLIQVCSYLQTLLLLILKADFRLWVLELILMKENMIKTC